jgi:hypothetical protein
MTPWVMAPASTRKRSIVSPQPSQNAGPGVGTAAAAAGSNGFALGAVTPGTGPPPRSGTRKIGRSATTVRSEKTTRWRRQVENVREMTRPTPKALDGGAAGAGATGGWLIGAGCMQYPP